MQDFPLWDLPGISTETVCKAGMDSRPQAARLQASIPDGTRSIEPARNGGNQ